MNTPVFEIEKLETRLREAIRAAAQHPVLLTENGRPAYVIRDLGDDDLMDELLEQSPDFLESIRRARQDKVEGRVLTLAEVRAKYTQSDV